MSATVEVTFVDPGTTFIGRYRRRPGNRFSVPVTDYTDHTTGAVRLPQHLVADPAAAARKITALKAQTIEAAKAAARGSAKVRSDNNALREVEDLFVPKNPYRTYTMTPAYDHPTSTHNYVAPEENPRHLRSIQIRRAAAPALHKAGWELPRSRRPVVIANESNEHGRGLELHHAGLRLELALVVPGSGIYSIGRSVIPTRTAQLLGLVLQQPVQRLLDARTDRLVNAPAQLLSTRIASFSPSPLSSAMVASVLCFVGLLGSYH